MHLNVIFTTLLFMAQSFSVDNHKILGLFPLNSKSHFVMFERLMKALAEKGHEVDVLSHFPLKNTIPRYTDLSVRGSLPIMVNNLTVDSMQGKNKYEMFTFITETLGTELCDAVLKTPVAKQLRDAPKKYDMIITEIFGTDCMLGFAYRYKVPVIALVSSILLPWGGDRLGLPDNPSYIPNYMVPFTSNMDLKERLINTVSVIACKIGYEIFSTQPSDKVAKNFFGPDLPHLNELILNISLVVVNSHYSINFVRPTLPNFIEVGGLHIEDQKPLPKHLEEAISLSSNYKGVIYLSMGSMIKTESFPSYKLKAIFDALKDLPYKVLWKAVPENFPKDLEIPSNIHFESWMPQLDVLCHPNVKVFISHGGLMGSQEGVYCGVPRLGIPLFADQELNIKILVQKRLAIMVDYDNITRESISAALVQLLDDPKYKKNAEEASRIFRDRPLSALDTAIYWVEYVIRHGGAPHLRSVGADLPWYKYYLVDVGLILFTALVLLVCIVAWLVLTVFRTVLGLITGNRQAAKHKYE